MGLNLSELLAVEISSSARIKTLQIECDKLVCDVFMTLNHS